MSKAKSERTPRPRKAHPPNRKPPTATDPVFAAIDAHQRAWQHQNKIGAEHTKAENKAVRTKDGNKTPEFLAIDRKWSAALDASRDRMRALIAMRPASVEAAAAQAAYIRALERFEEGSLFGTDHDHKALALDSFGRNLKRFVSRPYSIEFQSVLDAIADLESRRKDREARWRRESKRYRHSKRAKRDSARIRKLTKGPTTIEVATEAKTLRKIADIVTLMIPKGADLAIATVDEQHKRDAARRRRA